MTIPVRFLTTLITLYQWTLSPFIGRHCRFLPTCSQYAHEAIRVHGALRGCLLAARRLARCHPWGGSGFDPVPPRSPAAPSVHCTPPPPSSSPSPLHRPG